MLELYSQVNAVVQKRVGTVDRRVATQHRST